MKAWKKKNKNSLLKLILLPQEVSILMDTSFCFSFNFSQEFHSIVKSSRNQAMFDIFLKNNRINILLLQENILN